MYYSDDIIEEVRMKNDIVDVISGYVKLQRKGSSYFGLCPFHNEKSPSFSVSPGKTDVLLFRLRSRRKRIYLSDGIRKFYFCGSSEIPGGSGRGPAAGGRIFSRGPTGGRPEIPSPGDQ